MATSLTPDKLSILVVDDEPTFVQATSGYLAGAGYHVVSAPDAQEAVRALERETFDVAFIDLRMPGMSGVELMGRIKEHWPATEVVVVSAYASLESAVHAIRKDAFDYLLKPIDDLESLIAVAERVAEKKRMEGEKHRLVEQLRQKNTEIELLVEWGHSLSDSLVEDDVQQTAIAGLSALGGDAPTALFMSASETELAGVAVYPHAPAGESVITTPSGVTTAAGLAASAEVRRATESCLGHRVRMIFPLPLGGAAVGLLVLGEPPGDEPSVDDGILNHFAGQVTTALARALAYERISESTYRDGLTGLYNNRYLRERLVDEIARARRYSRPLGLLFIDVDGFKGVNDSHGHLAGDNILVAVSNIIRFDIEAQQKAGSNRASDVPVRYGGDEFVLLLPETNREGARIKAERVRESVEACRQDDDGSDLPTTTTVSIGVAEYPADADSSAALIDAADKALYKAKRAGRNCVVVAGQE
jgi:two-component system cell cycle response regulator